MVERELLDKFPESPEERVRALRVLLEVYRRKVKPELKEMYRRYGDKVYGPYYAAYFKAVEGFERPRLIYLGKEGSECVEFVRWLEEEEWDEVIMLAEIAASALVGVMEAVERKSGEADIVLVIAAANPCYWNVLRSRSGEGEVERVVEELEEVLGKWRPGMADRIREVAPEMVVVDEAMVREKMVIEDGVRRWVKVPVYEIWTGSGKIVTEEIGIGEAMVSNPVKFGIGDGYTVIVSGERVEEGLELVKREFGWVFEVLEDGVGEEVSELVEELRDLVRRLAAVRSVERELEEVLPEPRWVVAKRNVLENRMLEVARKLRETMELEERLGDLKELIDGIDIVIPFGDLAWTVADELHERFGVPVDEEGDAEGNAIVIVDWTDELAGEQLGFPSGGEDVRRVVEEYWNVRVIKVLDAEELLELLDS